MPTAITVKQMHKALSDLIKQGHGERKIALTDDDECNGIHECWFVPSIWREDEMEFLNLPHGVSAKDVASSYVVMG